MVTKLAGSNSNRAVVSEINVTPLVTVMLVLIFFCMITSPMLISGVNVDLPETNSRPISSQDEPWVATINNKGKIFLFEISLERMHLPGKLANITKEKKDAQNFVKGDRNVSYGHVVEIVAKIHAAGFSRVALISNIKNNEK